jgi:hypothetical protein
METLCVFNVKKVISKEVQIQKEIEGKPVTVLEKVAHIEEVPIALIKPRRKVLTGADIFFAAKVNEYMSRGLMSVHMISRRYDDDGGPFTKAETEQLAKLNLRKTEVASIYFKDKLELQKKTITQEQFDASEKIILDEFKRIQEEIDHIQRPHLSIFSQTAEFKAKQDSYYWWLFSLFALKDAGAETFSPYFKGKDFDKNLDILDEIDEKGEAHIKDALQKALYIIGAWVNGAEVEKGQHEKLLKDYEETSEYHPDVEVKAHNSTSNENLQ